MITRNYFRFKKIHYFFYATLCICAFFAIQYTALAITDPAIQKAIDQANTHLKAAQDAARDIPRFATKETANTTYKRFEAELELAEKNKLLPSNKSLASKEENFPKNEPVIADFSSLVMKLAVPSAVFNATFPVKPSETITFT